MVIRKGLFRLNVISFTFIALSNNLSIGCNCFTTNNFRLFGYLNYVKTSCKFFKFSTLRLVKSLCLNASDLIAHSLNSVRGYFEKKYNKNDKADSLVLPSFQFVMRKFVVLNLTARVLSSTRYSAENERDSVIFCKYYYLFFKMWITFLAFFSTLMNSTTTPESFVGLKNNYTL
jgi:hypothetical protein